MRISDTFSLNNVVPAGAFLYLEIAPSGFLKSFLNGVVPAGSFSYPKITISRFLKFFLNGVVPGRGFFVLKIALWGVQNPS